MSDDFRALLQRCIDWVDGSDDKAALSDAEPLVSQLTHAVSVKIHGKPSLLDRLLYDIYTSREVVAEVNDPAGLEMAKAEAQRLVERIDEQIRFGPYTEAEVEEELRAAEELREFERQFTPPEDGTYPTPNLTHDPSWGPVRPRPAPSADDENQETSIPPSVEDWGYEEPNSEC